MKAFIRPTFLVLRREVGELKKVVRRLGRQGSSDIASEIPEASCVLYVNDHCQTKITDYFKWITSSQFQSETNKNRVRELESELAKRRLIQDNEALRTQNKALRKDKQNIQKFGPSKTIEQQESSKKKY